MGPGTPSDARLERTLRDGLQRCRCVVIKVGSHALAAEPEMFARLARMAHALTRRPAGPRPRRARRVVLVSSGAIALGMTVLGMARRPSAIAALQAAAAAGQGVLMQRYGEAFGRHGLGVAQVLLTHADLASRSRTNNARAALCKLLDLGVVPVINENDAVAVDEIRFGDNDELAAMVAPLCGADLLLLLSDIEGLLDAEGRRIPFVARVDTEVQALVTEAGSGLGRGGMRSKLEAVRRATVAGAHVVIAPAGEPDIAERVLAGEDLGTFFPAQVNPLGTRKHWIAYTLRPRGAAVLDAGAADAVEQHGRSVLCVGVVGVRGAFVKGELISLVASDGREIARGLARLSAADAARLASVRGDPSEMLVHRDDLVLLASR